MQVEIWSDVVCPWCYIGKRRFEHALAEFAHADDVEVVWRSYQLDPTHPKGVRMPHAEALAQKFGADTAQLKAMNDHMVGLAAAEGLAYDFDSYTMINTFDAHRLTHAADRHGLGAAMHERLLRAQLVEGQVLDDVDTLVRLAAEVGVPSDEAREVLSTDAYTADVHADIGEARALGATGVPFFVIDRRYGVSGAQPAALFLRALETAYDDAQQRQAS
jgi:predicted DsbA family dithiol-disulfide isomerase